MQSVIMWLVDTTKLPIHDPFSRHFFLTPTFLLDSIYSPTTMFELLLRTKYSGTSTVVQCKALLVFHRRRIMILKHCIVSGTRGIGVKKTWRRQENLTASRKLVCFLDGVKFCYKFSRRRQVFLTPIPLFHIPYHSHPEKGATNRRGK
jgi:hypothetical protein